MIRTPPIEVLLSWPAPNYVNPETHGHAAIILNYFLITIVTIFFGLRIYVRVVVRKKLGWDDAFLSVGYLCAVGLTTVVILATTHYGWDRHVYDIRVDQYPGTMKLAMSSTVLFTAAASFTRLSLFCFYYRLVADSGSHWFKWVIHVNVAYTVCTFFATNYVAIFTCHPVSNYWKITAPSDSCMNGGLAAFVTGVINTASDFAATATPLPLIWKLQMPLRERVAVCVLFGLGVIVSIAGTVRNVFVYKSLVQTYDQTWYAHPVWVSAALEIDLGVICASVPVLRPLLRKIPLLFSNTFSRGTSAKGTKEGISGGAAYNKAVPAKRPGAMDSNWTTDTLLQTISDPVLEKDQSYEMKTWEEEEERVLTNDDLERGSQASMINHDTEPTQGVTRLWRKIRNSEPNIDFKDAAPKITRTSQIEVQSDTASDHAARST